MSLAFGHWSEHALCGIDCPPPKEKRKSRLREQRDELLAALKAAVGNDQHWVLSARAIIARIEASK